LAQETILTPVAVDHGFSHIKTASEIFPTAIAKVDIPITSENILQIGEDYYRVGGRRIDVLEGKTQTESFKLLTYVAIAKHLEARNVKKATVILQRNFGKKLKMRPELIKLFLIVTIKTEKKLLHIN